MPDVTDVFGGLAPLLKVRPELQLLCEFGSQWEAPHAADLKGWAPFHIVTEGACLLDVGDRRNIRLEAGDVAILPHGGRHTTRAVSGAGGAAIRTEKRPHDSLLVKTTVEGNPETRLICGRLRFEKVDGNMVLAALPAVVVVQAGKGSDAAHLRRIVETIRDELAGGRAGATAIATGLASALMLIVLRAHFEAAGAKEGVLALLAQRQTARALTAMLEEPARSWSLDALAEVASTSRATLVRLFQKATGLAPLAFLTELRLTLARNKLLANDAPLATIAEEIGYGSEAAFSRAYHRRFGIAPGADRSAQRKS